MRHPSSFTANLEHTAYLRHEVANSLSEIAAIITEAEQQGEKTSGKLSLATEIEQAQMAANNLRDHRFSLLVMGDLKRGKSTFINALLGEKLLPSDVNPCTALLTIIRYGDRQQVKIYDRQGNCCETTDLKTFKAKYTIAPTEAKNLEEQNQLAFPDLGYAAIEYPLPLLKDGLEIIDSPGLNDLEARNQQTLQHYHCHGVLFLFRAMQPCTLEEKRYLKNHFQGDIDTFFIINAWDEIKQSLVDPDNLEALKLAESKTREVFRANLAPYLNGHPYEQRVFEVSALTALRLKIRTPQVNLEGTGLPELLAALDNFLQQEKANLELQQAKKIALRILAKTEAAVNRRISLLDETLVHLKAKIAELEPEFAQLTSIRNSFQQEIAQTKANTSQAIADNFADYILSLESTFEADFLASQPDLNFQDFLDKNKRAEFQAQFQRAFERYMNDRLASWEFTAKQQLAASFDHLNQQGQVHQSNYQQVIAQINQKLIGSRFRIDRDRHHAERLSPWADGFGEIFFAVPDNVNGAINSFNTFWQTVLASICITIGLRVIGLLFTSVALNIFGAIVLGLGTVALQAEYVRRQFLELTKKEFIKYLPQIVAEQKPLVYGEIHRCFEAYEEQVIGNIDQDLTSRQLELANLVTQKEHNEINLNAEIQRLQNLQNNVAMQVQQIESLEP